MEFREFPNPEEQDYDINSSFKDSSSYDEEIDEEEMDEELPDDIPEDIYPEDENDITQYTNSDAVYGSYHELFDDRHR